MKLPEEFLEQMKSLLGDGFESYLESYEKDRFYGLRVNTDKISVEEFLKISPFRLKPIPWTHNGFYYTDEERPAKHPYYYAGLYYLQEPSAMCPAETLPVCETDRVLDVCAAPGGKSTALLNKQPALLVSNDISNSRAQALLKNLELFGGVKLLCMSSDPNRFAPAYENYFDKILIDAPCSGEGMFRKEPLVIKAWVEHGHGFYVDLQKSITANCLKMLKPGGMMVYSTCTFSPLEDEEIIAYMKSICPELKVLPVANRYEGFSSGIRTEGCTLSDEELSNLIRIFPHEVDGEGHFVALLQKGEPVPRDSVANRPKKLNEISGFQALPKEAKDFLESVSKTFENMHFECRNEKVSLVPEIERPLNSLRILRNGLLLGELKKNRFEPSQALALALRKDEFSNCIDLKSDSQDVLRYLKGETLILSEDCDAKDGWVLVTTDGYPLGFAKKQGANLKNKYLAGWRYQ